MSQGLNPAQHDAVHTLSGPLLVLAGAGTGKTRVVTFRIANLIRNGTRPGQILAVTFTNKAAGEMQERASALLGKKVPEKPEISTFHSLCVRILRRHIVRLGYPQAFTIYDRGDQESVARAALREIRVPDSIMRPGDLVNQISRWKTGSVRPPQAATIAETDKEHLAAMGYRRYQQALKNAGAVDFDDLLLLTEELFDEHPAVVEAEGSRFRHLLVDEYQDTNAPQYRIIKTLALPHRNLCVVGDDDQSIYGWRGAEVTHILQFKRDWPEAKVVRLEDNYRSFDTIIEFANRLIAHNKVRHPKVLKAFRKGGETPRIVQYADENVEAEQVVNEIRQAIFARTADPRDFAILFRTNEQPRAFETELRKAKLPYTLIGGMSFFDRREVKDVLAYLKVLVQPKDEVSLLRIINVPARGIGPKAVETLKAAATAQGMLTAEYLPKARELTTLPPAAKSGIDGLLTLLDDFRTHLEQRSPVDVVVDLLSAIGYQDEINRNYDKPEDQQARWATVEQVVNSLASYIEKKPSGSLLEFLDDIMLTSRDSDDKESQLARNAIMLMTMHSAKGLEFPQVYMVGMEEGLLPHHRSVAAEGAAIDEERRLCYVGVTRARDKLTLSLSLSRMKWGKPRPTIPSRFLFELVGKEDSPQAMAALEAAAQMGKEASKAESGKLKAEPGKKPSNSDSKKPKAQRPKPKR
jgi:DNA helicase-2/ATP-dependent DNA helicase PcrA